MASSLRGRNTASDREKKQEPHVATIELTPALLFTSISALSSLLIATWALSRRSHGWDKADKLEKDLHGDREKETKGLIAEFKEFKKDVYERQLPPVKDALSAVVNHVKFIRRGLNAHRSDEHLIEADVRKSLGDIARDEAAKAARETRKKIVNEVARHVETHRPDDSFVTDVLSAIEDSADSAEPETPHLPAPPHRPQPPRNDGRIDTGRGLQALPPPALRRRPTPPILIPRTDPSSDPPPPYNPDDTGRHRARKPPGG
jgi:hypothetical protein